MFTVTFLLVFVAFLLAVAAAVGRAPLWVSVILLTLAELIGRLPT